MILLPRSVRIYVAREPTNLRKSFEGLSNAVRHVLSADPLSGHVFIFINRRRTQVKLLMWTRGGYTIVHKRLERGQFKFPQQMTAEATHVSIDVHELAMLLEGLEVAQKRHARRWNPPVRSVVTHAPPS